MWDMISHISREFYRRFVNKLDGFQSIRVIDTGEIIPELQRGRMYTYQMRVYNISRSSPITNARSKLRLRTGTLRYNVNVQTNLCWSSNKGTMTINRDEHEWLNIATIREPQEGDLWGKTPSAELVFPTESGVLNPATVKISPGDDESASSEEYDSVTRKSLPVISGLLLFGTDNIRISSTNRPKRHYNLSMTFRDDNVRTTVEPYRKGWSGKLAKSIFGLYDEGFGEGVPLSDLRTSEGQ